MEPIVDPKTQKSKKPSAPIPPLTDPAEIEEYIKVNTGENAPPLTSWHYCNCNVITKVKPKKSNKVMAREAEKRKVKIELIKTQAEQMGIPADHPELTAKIAELSFVPPRKEKPKELDAPCNFITTNRNAMRVHLRTIHSVYYCEYCRTRWNKPQKQKWKEHKQKFPSGQCRFPNTGGMGPGKKAANNATNADNNAYNIPAATLPTCDVAIIDTILNVPVNSASVNSVVL